MKGLVLILALLAVGASAYCPGGPDIPSDANIKMITGPGFTYSPPCPGITGVDDQTGRDPMRISTGTTISITYHSCDSVFQSAGQLWIDWNKDNQFSADESIDSWQGLPEATHNYQITVPASYTGGATRARAMMQESGTPPMDPCAKFSWGALVDFRVSTSGGGGGSGSSGGLSGGSVLLIIVLVLTVVYVAGGCIYNRKKKGTTGMIESCPNNQFWFILPGLVKDGCSFTNRKCVKPTIAKITGKSSGNHADYEEL